MVVPITVLEELDHFKKGNESFNFHAREFVRTLDLLGGDKLFDGGVRIGPNQGRISVILEQKYHEDLELNFAPGKSDHRILNATYHLAKRLSPEKVFLVTKDVNLRMKAKAVGLMAQDYTTDHVKDISALYSGKRTEEDVSKELIDRMYQPPFEAAAMEFNFFSTVLPNEYIILRNGKKSTLSNFDPRMKMIKRVDKIPAYGIMPRNAEQTFALDVLLMNNDFQLASDLL